MMGKSKTEEPSFFYLLDKWLVYVDSIRHTFIIGELYGIYYVLLIHLQKA